MRAVLDTNVLASGLLSRTSTPGRILELWTFDRFELLISLPILDEIERTLNKPYFRERLSRGQIIAALELLQREAHVISISTTVHGAATHPEDDLILATAVSGNSDFLVTGDAQLLRLGEFQQVVICSSSAFLALLERTTD
jgi:putative PIN family toxin of toxin-antitoxin system